MLERHIIDGLKRCCALYPGSRPLWASLPSPRRPLHTGGERKSPSLTPLVTSTSSSARRTSATFSLASIMHAQPYLLYTNTEPMVQVRRFRTEWSRSAWTPTRSIMCATSSSSLVSSRTHDCISMQATMRTQSLLLPASLSFMMTELEE